MFEVVMYETHAFVHIINTEMRNLCGLRQPDVTYRSVEPHIARRMQMC